MCSFSRGKSLSLNLPEDTQQPRSECSALEAGKPNVGWNIVQGYLLESTVEERKAGLWAVACCQSPGARLCQEQLF